MSRINYFSKLAIVTMLEYTAWLFKKSSGHHHLILTCILTFSLGLFVPALRRFCRLRSTTWYDMMWYDNNNNSCSNINTSNDMGSVPDQKADKQNKRTECMDVFSKCERDIGPMIKMCIWCCSKVSRSQRLPGRYRKRHKTGSSDDVIAGRRWTTYVDGACVDLFQLQNWKGFDSLCWKYNGRVENEVRVSV